MKFPFFPGTCILFLFCLLCATVAGLITGFFNLIGFPLNDTSVQILTQIATFLVPALLYARIAYDDKWKSLHIKKAEKPWDYALFVFVLIGAIPLISYLQGLNAAMSFPASLAALEQMMREMEQQAQALVVEQISGTRVLDLMLALLTTAVLPAICEEFLFRGVILTNLLKRTSRMHLSVWLSAIFFSFVHFQFFGFLPRVILGAVLGYAFVYSKTLWIPIILHFLNNATAVITYFIYQKGWTSEDPLSPDAETATLWMAVVSFVVISLIWYRYNKAHSNFA